MKTRPRAPDWTAWGECDANLSAPRVVSTAADGSAMRQSPRILVGLRPQGQGYVAAKAELA
jgi:hypothetical protein